MDDVCGDVLDLGTILEELVVRPQPAPMDEEMRLRAGKGQEESWVLEALLDVLKVWPQPGDGHLPLHEPLGRLKACRLVVRGEPPQVRVENGAPLERGDDAHEVLPAIWEYLGRTVLEEPMHIFLPEKENAAQSHRRHVLRVRLRVSERERRTPAAAQNEMPAGHLAMLAEQVQVVNKMPGGVVVERRQGLGIPCAALIQQNDAVERRVEELPIARIQTRGWATMEEESGLTVGVPALLVIELMLAVARLEVACLVRLDWRVQRSENLFASFGGTTGRLGRPTLELPVGVGFAATVASGNSRHPPCDTEQNTCSCGPKAARS